MKKLSTIAITTAAALGLGVAGVAPANTIRLDFDCKALSGSCEEPIEKYD